VQTRSFFSFSSSSSF